MNRNSLLEEARLIIDKNKDFKPSTECKFHLSGKQVREKMMKILDKIYKEGKIKEHGLVVAKELAFVLSGGDTDLDKEISEDQLFKLELNSFMKLIETEKTQERIQHTLETGKPLNN